MYKRDLLTAEIERLAQVLARIMGLKLEGKLLEANEIFRETMDKSFGISEELILNTDLSVFESWMKFADLPAEKLDSLSEFLYYELGISLERNKAIAPKLNIIYDYLANHHKIVHLVNFHRKETIQQYL